MRRSDTIVGKVIRLIGLMGLMGACSSEQEPVEPEARIPLEVMPCMTPYEEEEYAPTRAWLPPTGFSEVVGSDSKSIGICFTKDGEEPKKGFFVYSDTQKKWYTSVENIQATTYYLYGYYPHEAGVICNISSPEDNSSYRTGAVLTLSNQPSATPNDMCVVVGAKNGYNNGYDPDNDYAIGGLVPGDFSYVAAAATTGNPPTAHGNYVYLLFDHLYSCLRLQFKVDATYNSLRRIKLKKLDIQAYAGSVQYPIKNEITVTLAATNDGSNPIQSIVYTPSGTANEEEWSSFFTSIDGELVTTDYGPLKDCYFAPKNITKLILKSTYDIYDTNGNLIREEATAENALVFNDLFNPEPVALRSKRYTVKLTIQPTYLYVMSDPDLDNPRLEVD